MTTPLFLGLAAAYVSVAAVLLWRSHALRGGVLGAAAVAPVALFAVGGYTGAPTGGEPGLLLVNTAVLLVVALVIALSVVSAVLGHRLSPGAGFAAMTTLLLLLGTAGYLVNLLGRVAVVVTGMSERQASLEDRYWVASAYLRGLPSDPDPLAFVLTWMDLVQLGYVVTAYVATAGLARLLRTERVVSARAGRLVERCAWLGAGLLVVSIALALALPRDADAVPAGLAFGLSIPFMTTLLPFVLAVSARSRPVTASAAPAGTQPPRPSRPASTSLG